MDQSRLRTRLVNAIVVIDNAHPLTHPEAPANSLRLVAAYEVPVAPIPPAMIALSQEEDVILGMRGLQDRAIFIKPPLWRWICPKTLYEQIQQKIDVRKLFCTRTFFFYARTLLLYARTLFKS